MFARLRGIVEADIDNVIDRLAHGLFLTEHIDKQVCLMEEHIDNRQTPVSQNTHR